MYLNDPAHSSYNGAESQISAANAGDLSEAWVFSAGATVASGVTAAAGALYFGAWDGSVFAVRASDGQMLWKQFAGMAPAPTDPSCFPAIGVSSQPAISGGAVVIGGGDSAVYAFDTATGRQLWRVALADPQSGAYIWSSITVAGPYAFAGLASLADCPLVRAQLARIHLATQDVARMYTVPAGAEGASIWSTPAVDRSTNTVFVTTGNGDADPSTHSWGGAMLGVDAESLAVRAYYLLPSNLPDTDMDWGSSPMLFTAVGVEMVAATGKDGVIYANRRDNLAPVWTQQLAVGCVAPDQGCGSISTPAFNGERLYVGAGAPDADEDYAGSMYALDASTGAVIWRKDLRGPVLAAPAVANGVVFAATLAGVMAFDAGTGEVLWSDERAYGPAYGQAVICDGTLYATYASGRVVAWRPNAAGDSNAPPRRGHRLSGRGNQ